MKKEEETTSLAVRPDVKSTVNLNMNQNDLIEIAVQEQLALLEAEIEETNVAIRKHREKSFNEASRICDTFAMKIARKNKGYMEFMELVKKLGLEAKGNLDSDEVDYDNEDSKQRPVEAIAGVNRANRINVESYPEYDFDRYEYKNPVAQAKRGVCTNYTRVNVPESLSISLRASNPNGLTVSWQSGDINTSESFQEDYRKRMSVLAKEEARLCTELYNLNLRRLEYEHGEKRIKAMILKKSLSKSEEGKAVLKMLEEATKIKVLS